MSDDRNTTSYIFAGDDMDSFRIQGGHRLAGHASIDGSKNATLPLMAAAILADEPVTLHGVPDLSDVANMQNLLEKLGIEIELKDSLRTVKRFFRHLSSNKKR